MKTVRLNTVFGGILLSVCSFIQANSQTLLAGWDVSALTGGNGNYGPAILNTSVNNNNIICSGLTKGSGIGNSGTGAARGWGGTDWVATSETAALTAGDYISFTLQAKPGFMLSFSSLTPFSYLISSNGPANGMLQYSIDGITYFDITSVSYTNNGGVTLPVIDLSSVSALQNIPSSVTVYFRLVNWGGGASGGKWYIYDVGNSADPDFAILGSIGNTDAGYYFRTRQNGNWNNASTWQSSADSINWSDALASPTSAAQSILIQKGNIVTINSDASAKLLTVDTNATLTYSASAIKLTVVDDGSAATDFAVYGRYELFGTQPVFANNAAAVIFTGGEVRALANAAPSESDDFAQNTKVYFKTNAVFSWYITTPFKTSNAIYFPNASASDKAILQIHATIGAVGANSTTTVNGKLEIADGYTLTMRNTGAKIFRDGIGGTGNLIHNNTCGPFRINAANGVIDGSVNIELQNSTGNAFEITAAANVTISGTPSLTVGTAAYPSAILEVAGTLTHTGSTSINLLNGKLSVDGALAGTGKIKTSSTTDISINGTAIINPDSQYNYVHNFLLPAQPL